MRPLAAVACLGLAVVLGGVSCAPDPPEEELAAASDALEAAFEGELVGPAGAQFFGRAVAVSGDTVAVGMFYDSVALIDVRVFVRDGAGWSLQAQVIPKEPVVGDFFGSAVALSGDLLVAGAMADGQNGIETGAAYVFARSGTLWEEQWQLHPADPFEDQWFGKSAAMSEDTIVVGAPTSGPLDGPAGAAYVFVRDGAGYKQEQKLVAEGGAPGDRFGYAVAISGDTVAIGAPGDDEDGGAVDSGAAYVFVRSKGVWTEQARLVAPGASAKNALGYSVAVSGDTVLAGARTSGANGVNSGSAHVFVRDGDEWTPQAAPLIMGSDVGDVLGTCVALQGDTAAIGAPQVDSPLSNMGRVYLFVREDSIWKAASEVAAPGGHAEDVFGIACAMSEDVLVVGAPGADSAYVFQLASSNGAPCAGSTSCLSGFCSDGVCCDLACDGDTVACSAAEKGSGDDGVCGPVAADAPEPGEKSYYSCEAAPAGSSSPAQPVAVALALALAARRRRARVVRP